MTTKRENEILTRVGTGTPMGALMRRYWIPAAKSSELAADGSPLRLLLLGERLVAFRDTRGRVGVMDHRCPHRCASLFFGRNEEDGIRCAYHGWKFDVDGNCVDMPNVPPHQDFKHKVRARAYSAAERNGLVWVFMGDQACVPPLPEFEATLLPEHDVVLHFVQRECNWLQAMEGDLDSSHIGFLHFGGASGASFSDATGRKNLVMNRAPEYEVAATDFGVTYGVHRPADDGGTYWRIGHFLFPYWVMAPICALEHNILARAWVPMDDTHTMFLSVAHRDAVPGSETKRPIAGTSLVENLRPNTTDWYGRFRLVENEENDYLIDRDVQRTASFTGIEGIHTQDQAITESMSPIVDRSLERLAPSDVMITRVRKALLNAARALDREGIAPPAADDPGSFRDPRGGYFTSHSGADWLDIYRSRLTDTRQPRQGVTERVSGAASAPPRG